MASTRLNPEYQAKGNYITSSYVNPGFSSSGNDVNLEARAIRLRCGTSSSSYTQLVIQNEWVVLEKVANGTVTKRINLWQ